MTAVRFLSRSRDDDGHAHRDVERDTARLQGQLDLLVDRLVVIVARLENEMRREDVPNA